MSFFCAECAKVTDQDAELHGAGVCDRDARWGHWREENSLEFHVLATTLKSILLLGPPGTLSFDEDEDEEEAVA